MSEAPRHRRELGFSIVELMVASTISVIMFTVIIQIFSNSKEAYRIQEGASVLNENARYAVSHLQYYLRLADHWGGVESDEVNVDVGVPGLAINCTGSAVVSSVGFRGYDGGAARPLNCINASNYEPNTDAFFIRYGAPHADTVILGDTDVPPLSGAPSIPDASSGEGPVDITYMLGANGDGLWVRTRLGYRAFIVEGVDVGSLPSDMEPASDPLSITNYRYQSMLYFIRSCSNPGFSGTSVNCDANDDSVPTLVRMTLNPDFSFTEQDVVAGVENMQLRYGLDTDADMVADTYVTAATVNASNAWNAVIAVRVSVIIANLERDNTIDDTTTYFLQDYNYTPPNEARNFRRTQYDFTVQIRNMNRA